MRYFHIHYTHHIKARRSPFDSNTRLLNEFQNTGNIRGAEKSLLDISYEETTISLNIEAKRFFRVRLYS